MIATYIGSFTSATGAEQDIFKLDPPWPNTCWEVQIDDKEDCDCGECRQRYEYVIASAVVAMCSGPETLVFPCTIDGDVTSWGEIGGGRGYLSPSKAIRDMGYEIVAPADVDYPSEPLYLDDPKLLEGASDDA